MWAVVHCCIVHIFPQRSIIVRTKRRPGSRTRASCSFHAIAPLKRVEFLIKFVSGLGRMMFSFLPGPEFLCINKSLNSVTV